MADAKETAFFRGEGGAVIEMDLPLSEPLQYQLTRGQLKQVNADGTPLDAQPTMDLVSGEIRRPGKNANKNEWVGYAVSQGMSVNEADGMTKADLIEKFGAAGDE